MYARTFIGLFDGAAGVHAGGNRSWICRTADPAQRHLSHEDRRVPAAPVAVVFYLWRYDVLVLCGQRDPDFRLYGDALFSADFHDPVRDVYSARKGGPPNVGGSRRRVCRRADYPAPGFPGYQSWHDRDDLNRGAVRRGQYLHEIPVADRIRRRHGGLCQHPDAGSVCRSRLVLLDRSGAGRHTVNSRHRNFRAPRPVCDHPVHCRRRRARRPALRFCPPHHGGAARMARLR